MLEVASLVPAECSYPYSRSTIYRNITNFICVISGFNKILWKNSIDFHVLLSSFIISLLGIKSNVLLADILSMEGLFLTFFLLQL